MKVFHTTERFIYIHTYPHLENAFAVHVSRRYTHGERIINIRLFKIEIEISMKNIF